MASDRITVQDAVDSQCCIDGIMRFVVKTRRIAAPASFLLKMADKEERQHIRRIISGGYGDGYTDSDGYGYGCGYGDSDSYSDGDGYGKGGGGDGDGDGKGHSYGYGCDGSIFGGGDDCGYGYAYGYGDIRGDGIGDDYGDDAPF
jgi:hypothetical protein